LTYKISPNQGYSPNATNAIYEAADAWNRIANTRLLIITTETLDTSDTSYTSSLRKPVNNIIAKKEIGAYSVIRAAYASPLWTVTRMNIYIDSSLLRLDTVSNTVSNSNVLYNCMLHEFGHILGLDHPIDKRLSEVMGYVLLLDMNGNYLQTSRININSYDITDIRTLVHTSA